MDIEIRTVGADEWTAFRAAMARGFGDDLVEQDPERAELWQAVGRFAAAYVDGEIVGTSGTVPFDLTVPDGMVPMAGTTVITTSPTHRRRGVLTRMMEAHLAESREHDEPTAGLWASEGRIYGRYGYGVAAYWGEMTVDTRFVEFRDPAPIGRPVEFVSADAVLDVVRPVYEAVRPDIPGMLSRSDDYWKLQILYDPPDRRRGNTAMFHVVYREDGQPVGYARYRMKSGWTEGFPDKTLLLDELLAMRPDVYRELWRFVCGVDLVTKVTYENTPVDEPLPWLLTDPRRPQATYRDSLWVRFLDVPAALTARRFRAPGRLVIEVHDAFLPDCGGRFELEVADDGKATCSRTEDSADATLATEDLAALYLGGNRAWALARAGRIEGRPEAVRLLDSMFGWHRAPWCPHIF